MTVKVGSGYVHYNCDGAAKPPNAQGHYNFRGQKLHVTRVTKAQEETR
jgi:hypothetical protein